MDKMIALLIRVENTRPNLHSSRDLLKMQRELNRVGDRLRNVPQSKQTEQFFGLLERYHKASEKVAGVITSERIKIMEKIYE